MPVAASQRRLLLHRAFVLGVVVKGVDGLSELVGGWLLLSVSHAQIRRWVDWLTRGELLEDPHDPVANLLRRAAADLSLGAQHFAAAYLLVQGVVKLLLCAGLLRGVRWTYPAGIGLLALFGVYQLLRLTQGFSPLLALLTVVNLLVIALIAWEWRYRAATRVSAPAATATAPAPPGTSRSR